MSIADNARELINYAGQDEARALCQSVETLSSGTVEHAVRLLGEKHPAVEAIVGQAARVSECIETLCEALNIMEFAVKNIATQLMQG